MTQAQQLPDGQKRNSAIMAIVRQMAEDNPSGALGLAQQLPAGRQRESAMNVVINQLAQQDPAQALSSRWHGKAREWAGITTCTLFSTYGPTRT